MALRDIILNIGENCRGSNVRIGNLVDSIKERAFGVLLFLPALIILLPVSLIPGVSSLCALIALFAAIHIFLGRNELWLPERIRNISLCSRRMTRILEKMHYLSKKLDRFSKPRMKFMTQGIAAKLTSAMGIVLAFATIVLGFIPLMDIPLMAPIVFFGLGICTNDGLMTGIGWLIFGGCAGGIGYFI